MSASSAYYLNWTIPVVAGSAVAGTLFSTQPVLFLTDVYGDAEAGAGVVLYLYSDSYCTSSAGGVGLAGDSVATNSSGYAVFSAFEATTAGSYYVQAKMASVNSSCSTYALSVTAATPSVVVYTTQPGGSVSAGSVFTTQPVVNVQDAYGNVVSGSSVGLTAFTNAACTTAGLGSLTNTPQTTLSTGSFAFSAVSYDRAQTIYIKAVAGIDLDDVRNC